MTGIGYQVTCSNTRTYQFLAACKVCEFTKIQAHLHPHILQIKSYISFFEGNKINFDVYGSRNTTSLTYICQWFSYLPDTGIFAPEISQYCPSIPQNDDSIHLYILPRTNVFPEEDRSKYDQLMSVVAYQLIC